jgi:hypothetical protein
MHTIPQALIEAENLARWPSGLRLSGSVLSSVAPFMSTIDFELLSIDQILGKKSSQIADLETLTLFAKKPSSALHHRVYIGNNAQGPSDLPWLDVDKALVIGGGADYGDDTWLALDYRLNLLDPRIVVSQYRHYGPEPARAAPSHINWLAIAPNIQGFLALVEGAAVRGQ